jgi:uncharacterized membrane protein YvbJ
LKSFTDCPQAVGYLTEDNMYCNKCGKNSPGSSNFCNFCGEEFLNKKFTKKSYENYYKPRKYIDWQTPLFLTVCVLIIAAIIFFIIPSIKKFASNKFDTAAQVYASVERSYKSKCDEIDFKALDEEKGSKNEKFVKMSGKINSIKQGDQKMIFEINVTKDDDNTYSDKIIIEYNDILNEVKENDVIVFWGKDKSCGDDKDKFKDEDPRVSVEYINIVNQHVFW